MNISPQTSKLPFNLPHTYMVAGQSVAYDANLGTPESLIPGGDDKSLRGKLGHAYLKPFLHSLRLFQGHLVASGYIAREAGRLIKKYLKEGDTFLDIGCGDMRLRRYLPKSFCYNAFDIRIPVYQLWRQRYISGETNIAIATMHNIPLPDSSVSVGVGTEIFYDVLNIEKAVAEIYRILKTEGVLILSIPNGFCYKYQKKGPHPYAVNWWTFEEFPEFMRTYGFTLLEKKMRGLWVPLPVWLTNTSYALPISHPKEFYNCTFFYVFKK